MSLMLIGVALSAAAQPCVPLSEVDLAELIRTEQDALFLSDGPVLAEVEHRLERDAPCLERVVAPEEWAPHLVVRSVYAYSRNQDWQSPLEAALLADPTVSRGVGEEHPIHRWTPPPTSEAGAVAVPDFVTVHVDGRQVRYVPRLSGPHLVQIEQDGQLRSVYGTDLAHETWEALVVWPEPEPEPVAEPQAAELPPPPVPQPRRGKALVAGGLALGAAGLGVGLGAWGLAQANAPVSEAERKLYAPLNLGGSIGGVVGVGLAAFGVVRLVRTGGRTQLALGASAGGVQ